MTSLVAWIKQIIREQRLRKRFPRSEIYEGAAANENSVLGEYSVLFRNAVLLNSVLGAYSYVQADTFICNAEVGPFCSIAGSVNIGLGAHPTFMVSTNPAFYDNEQPLPKFFTKGQLFTQIFPKTIIGADVWIGQGVMVKAGVKVGTGAVIGAGSVVTRDIPPYAIAVGNPCRPIKLRFSEEICQKMLLSKWWEFSEERLEKLAPLFSDPEAFLAALELDNE